uniref:Uncharacterized protein n=1 Tax=Cyprinus carpio TaxID=7962 RepID=A0A8C1TQ54_CYPCA
VFCRHHFLHCRSDFRSRLQTQQELKSQGRLTRPVLCSLHPGQELRIFYESCDLTMCLEYAANFHRNHHCSSAHEDSLRRVDTSQEALQARTDTLAGEMRAFARIYASVVEVHCCSLLRSLEDLSLQCRNQLHLQKAQLQQALSDVRGRVDFVTMRRLMNLVELGFDQHPTTVAHDNANSICFLPQESAGISCGGSRVVTARGESSLSSGEQMGRGGHPVLVSIVHKERKGGSVEAAVVDKGDGSYGVSYTPGSPFVLNVKKKLRRHYGIFDWCSFCSSGGNKEARCGCTGTVPAGFRVYGHGHKGHPGKPPWSCCGSVVEAVEYILHNLCSVPPRGHLRTVEL